MYEDALVTLNKDKKLKKIISSVGECKIRTISNPFEALIEAIITQQISDSAGKAISLRFKNLFGTKYPTANDIVKLSKDEIKSVGLSRMKAEYIFDISNMIVDKKLNFNINNFLIYFKLSWSGTTILFGIICSNDYFLWFFLHWNCF